ncbi:radical SAM protein [Sporolactobacillus sp. THM19-2]|nr:radical SAM protein [Sporolactobacillus sp. THM19-2]
MNFISYLKKNNINFCINMTVNEINYKDVDRTIKLAHYLGAEDISVATVKPNGRGKATLSYNALRKIWKQVIDNKNLISKKFKIWGSEVTLFLYDFNTYKESIERNENGSCTFGSVAMHVKSNGDILGCTACDDVVLGNIFNSKKSDVLRNTWGNNMILNKIRSKKYLIGECKTCKYLNFCGGCRCRAFGVYGNLYGPDPYCPIVMKKKMVTK